MVTYGNAPFQPDWTLSPGDMLARLLTERGITASGLADRMGMDAGAVEAVLSAMAPPPARSPPSSSGHLSGHPLGPG